MEAAILVVIVVIVIALFMRSDSSKDFDDPKPMSNQHLLSAIAGQADWLEKMSRAPIESQNSPSIVEIAKKRRGYIARLCLEVVSRGATDEGPKNRENRYPGALGELNVFSEVYEYARDLEAAGSDKENSAIKSVKEKLFKANGVFYPTRWEL